MARELKASASLGTACGVSAWTVQWGVAQCCLKEAMGRGGWGKRMN